MSTDPALLHERLVALGAHFGHGECQILAALMRPKALHDGQVFVAEHAASPGVAMVWEGRLVATVRVKGRDVELGSIPAGALTGEVSFLDGGGATATVRAEGPATVLLMDRSTFDELYEVNSRIALRFHHAVTRTLAGRVRRAAEMLEGRVSAEPRALQEAWGNLLGTGAA